jgi:hypothetical protein
MQVKIKNNILYILHLFFFTKKVILLFKIILYKAFKTGIKDHLQSGNSTFLFTLEFFSIEI